MAQNAHVQDALVANGVPTIGISAILTLVHRMLSSVILHRNAVSAIEEIEARNERARRVIDAYVELGFRKPGTGENQP
jgi:hypothetical protein